MTPSPMNAIRAMASGHKACLRGAPDGLEPLVMASPAPRNPMPVTLGDIQAAAERIKGSVVRTPTMLSQTLSELTGATIYVKFENLQFTAAYKERGALNKLLSMDEATRARGVIAASAGNHAQGVAYHGRRLGVPVTIVMPRST